MSTRSTKATDDREHTMSSAQPASGSSEPALLPPARSPRVGNRFRFGVRLHHLLFIAFTIIAAAPIAVLAAVGGKHLLPERTRLRSRTASSGRPQPDHHHVALRQGRGGGLRADVRERRTQPPGRRPDRLADVVERDPCLPSGAGWNRRSRAQGPVRRSGRRPAAAAAGGSAVAGRQRPWPDRDQQPVSRPVGPAGLLSRQAASRRASRPWRRHHQLSRRRSSRRSRSAIMATPSSWTPRDR